MKLTLRFRSPIRPCDLTYPNPILGPREDPRRQSKSTSEVGAQSRRPKSPPHDPRCAPRQREPEARSRRAYTLLSNPKAKSRSPVRFARSALPVHGIGHAIRRRSMSKDFRFFSGLSATPPVKPSVPTPAAAAHGGVTRSQQFTPESFQSSFVFGD